MAKETSLLGDIHKGDYALLHTFDRVQLEVSAKARVSIRRLILKDHDADVRIELEGSRAWFKHANAISHALVIEGAGDTDA